MTTNMMMDLMYLFLGFYSVGVLVYLGCLSFGESERYGMLRFMMPILIFVALALLRYF